MRFKNIKHENMVLSDVTTLILSDNEMRKYDNGSLKKENIVETADMTFNVQPGEAAILLNGKPYEIKIEDYPESELIGIKMTIADKIVTTIEKTREINKYDCIREFIKHLKEL